MGPQVQTFSALPVECPFVFFTSPRVTAQPCLGLFVFVVFMLMSAIIKTCSKGNNKKRVGAGDSVSAGESGEGRM